MTPPTPEEVEALRRFVRRHAPPCGGCGGCATVMLLAAAGHVLYGTRACDTPECRVRVVCGACGEWLYVTPGEPCGVCGAQVTARVAEVRDLHDAVAVRWAVRP